MGPLTGPSCAGCGRPFESDLAALGAEPLCLACRKGMYAFDRARSYAKYSDNVIKAITLLKYEKLTRLGNWFASRLEEKIRSEPEIFAIDLVVPVPLHHARQRERGYNQAEVIARPLARTLGLPLRRILVRKKPRPPKLLLSRRERWESVRGAFATRPGANVDNLRVLLLDDVCTTGATLDSCSRTLKLAGAKSVVGLTVARVPMSGALGAPPRAKLKQTPTLQKPSNKEEKRSVE
jgi:ComF family protein